MLTHFLLGKRTIYLISLRKGADDPGPMFPFFFLWEPVCSPEKHALSLAFLLRIKAPAPGEESWGEYYRFPAVPITGWVTPSHLGMMYYKVRSDINRQLYNCKISSIG